MPNLIDTVCVLFRRFYVQYSKSLNRAAEKMTVPSSKTNSLQPANTNATATATKADDEQKQNW